MFKRRYAKKTKEKEKEKEPEPHLAIYRGVNEEWAPKFQEIRKKITEMRQTLKTLKGEEAQNLYLRVKEAFGEKNKLEMEVMKEKIKRYRQHIGIKE